MKDNRSKKRINHPAGGCDDGHEEYPVEPVLTQMATRWAQEMGVGAVDRAPKGVLTGR